MKNKLMIMTAAMAAVLGLSASVQATPISGYIGFNGSYSTVPALDGNLSTVTSFTIPFAGVAINAGQTGGALGGATLVSFIGSIGVNGNTPVLLGQQLWKVQVGSTFYNFVVGSVTQTLSPDNSALTLTGSGTLGDSISALDNTAGTYTLAFGVSGPSFTFASTAASNLPDGGATVLLLGAALSAMGLLRRKLIA